VSRGGVHGAVTSPRAVSVSESWSAVVTHDIRAHIIDLWVGLGADCILCGVSREVKRSMLGERRNIEH
jgi:hypothetical protein